MSRHAHGDAASFSVGSSRDERELYNSLIVSFTQQLDALVSQDNLISDVLPTATFFAGRAAPAPIPNAAFHPGAEALPAPAFAGILRTQQSELQTNPILENPVQDGRDARLWPGVTIEFFTLGELLVPVQRGAMMRESTPGDTPSYWCVIPQIGRVWRETTDGSWSRAAFPLMLVNDTENHAHQGLAAFAYRGNEVSGLVVQFVQQTAPYRLCPLFVAWGTVRVEVTASDLGTLESQRATASAELAARLTAKAWVELVNSVPPETLDGFGGPLPAQWRVAAALVREGTLYYQKSTTPYGPYPYPLEMRFGVRSVMKSIGVPLALLRLAQVYGPWVLTLKVGEYVAGLDPKWSRVRFLDAANMASGFGGMGTLKTNPNDSRDGYLDGNYDAWYTTPSHADKVAQINADLHPYPWEPGAVMRYRDQDFYLLGAAIDGFLKSLRGPEADIWEMLKAEVFAPIGIQHAPTVRTREIDGRDGVVWLNAGYYPTLDDLAKIALLYQSLGAYGGQQILHRQLTSDLLGARDAIQKDGDFSVTRVAPDCADVKTEFFKLGFHFVPYVGSGSRRLLHLPTMSGFGENEITLYPNHLISIVIGKAASPSKDERARFADDPQTIRAVDRLAPF